MIISQKISEGLYGADSLPDNEATCHDSLLTLQWSAGGGWSKFFLLIIGEGKFINID